ncbi:MAG: GIY-YIG nuclease family protein [Candidatus Chromulinivorax sp.]|nr:GIY-YIG nuclease family protein [Candidatus Chromulinivorax sp.]
MFFVYLLRSINNLQKTYVGYSSDVEERLKAHNAGRSIYTQEDRPWQLEAFFCFNTELKALRFEKYLKTNSGKIFLKRYVIAEKNE